MARIDVSLEVGADRVAVITISNPPVNALAPALLAGLKEKYLEALSRDDVDAIVLTGANGRFSGGFDIGVFEKVQATGDVSLMPDVSVEIVVNLVEDAKKPSVAAIQGLALGGGLEFTMACHARISTPEAQLGLPELTLGVIPGFGGTQRLPRLVGLSKAVEMLLLSKSISAKEGNKLGLIDAIASPGELLHVARCWALDIAYGRKPWLSSLRRTDKLGSLSEAREITKAARLQAKRVAPNLPQHQACLDAVEEGISFGGYAGVLKEAKMFKELVLSSTSRALVHVFFAQRNTSKVPTVTDIGLKPRSIRKVAVIGGGLMGSGIATALIRNNIAVTLKEVNAAYLDRGMKIITANLEGLVRKGTMSRENMNKALTLLKGTLDYSEFKNVDMVIEAVIEKVPLKQSIFSEIEKICHPSCILATNTSTINLHVVGAKTSSQNRIIGAHFFSPAHVMPLLEIVRSDKTSPQVILDLLTVANAIKKVPVVVGNCTGFAVNRTFFPYSQAANLLLHLGVDLYRIDRVISNFGMPMGPFQLQDVSGYGVAMAVRTEFAAAFAGRTFESGLLDLMVENGRNGKSNGKGYYIYEKGMKPKPDPSLAPILEASRKRAGIMPGGKPIAISDKDILEMIFFPVINEACRVMDEDMVVRASDLDIASIFGMGFPRHRGGLVFWADSIGAGYIHERLKKWSEKFGGFFKPSPYVEERAVKGLTLSMPKALKGSRSRM